LLQTAAALLWHSVESFVHMSPTHAPHSLSTLFLLLLALLVLLQANCDLLLLLLVVLLQATGGSLLLLVLLLLLQANCCCCWAAAAVAGAAAAGGCRHCCCCWVGSVYLDPSAQLAAPPLLETEALEPHTPVFRNSQRCKQGQIRPPIGMLLPLLRP
jgi:hypothetical protein